MIKPFLDAVIQFAEHESVIESVIIVGSYARGTNTKHSDIDLCIITTDKKRMTEHPDFIRQFGTVIKKQAEYYGACTSIRVWYANGMEVEYGIVEPSWIHLPLDERTRRVLSDGYRVIIDKNGYFQKAALYEKGLQAKQKC